MLRTIESSGRVLELFTVERPECGVTEVAEELGFSKTRAHALLASLADVGLLRRTSRGRYRLGWRLLGLNRVLVDTTDFRAHAWPVMEALSDQLGEPTHLATLAQGNILYVDRSPASRVSAEEALPAHASALGKALIADLMPGERRRVLEAHGMPRLTRRTTVDALALDRELLQVAECRVAIDRDESTPGVCCVASPILGPEGQVVAAIGLSAPSDRFAHSIRIYRCAVMRAADHVSRRLRLMPELPKAA